MTSQYGYGSMNSGMMGHIMAPPPPPPGGVNMNPALNNEPLQFNLNKGNATAMPMAKDLDINASVNNMNTDMDLEREESVGSNGSMGQGQAHMMGWQINPQMMNSIVNADPSMMSSDPGLMMANMTPSWPPGGIGPMPPAAPHTIDFQQTPRQPIQFNSCTLYPPPATAPPPTTRERPPGCRTIFVGGLPENVTEEIITEVFENCGHLVSLRVSKKKNFCHIRFDEEYAVDKALQISAYRMKIENKDDKANTGRLHVDYAQARDDLYEWECQQRCLAREMRHRYRMEQDRLRPPSPPPVIHYTDHESQLLLERLKGDETFPASSEVLITWLERGDCNRRTSNHFYSMVQSVNAHVRRLINEKASYNEEFEQMKLNFRHRLEGILRQFEQMDKVFRAASRQKAWDHFSKAQRKNIDTWRSQCQEMKSREEQEFLRERKEDEMEMSDSEESAPDEPSSKRKRIEDGETIKLRDENDSLKCELEAYKNEVNLLKQEHKDERDEAGKEQQIRLLQQTLKGMQQQLMMTRKDQSEKEAALQDKYKCLQQQNELLKKSGVSSPPSSSPPVTDSTVKKAAECELVESIAVSTDTGDALEVTATKIFGEREARLIGLISTFLHVHPFGASVDYISSYLTRLNINIRASDIEDLLELYPTVFTQHVHGVGASIEKSWQFAGFG